MTSLVNTSNCGKKGRSIKQIHFLCVSIGYTEERNMLNESITQPTDQAKQVFLEKSILSLFERPLTLHETVAFVLPQRHKI